MWGDEIVIVIVMRWRGDKMGERFILWDKSIPVRMRRVNHLATSSRIRHDTHLYNLRCQGMTYFHIPLTLPILQHCRNSKINVITFPPLYLDTRQFSLQLAMSNTADAMPTASRGGPSASEDNHSRWVSFHVSWKLSWRHTAVSGSYLGDFGGLHTALTTFGFTSYTTKLRDTRGVPSTPGMTTRMQYQALANPSCTTLYIFSRRSLSTKAYYGNYHQSFNL
jgi:hypothetical protein